MFLSTASEQGRKVAEVKDSARFTAIVSQLLTNRSNHTDSVQREPLPETVPKSSYSDGAFEQHNIKHGQMLFTYGEVNPSGKLTETFPMKLSDNPSFLFFPGEGNRVEYREGIFVGYRYYDAKEVKPDLYMQPVTLILVKPYQ